MHKPTSAPEMVIAELLQLAGLPSRDFQISPVAAGGNNRIDVVDTTQGRFITKWYFAGSKDTRDRLASEWAFLRYANDAGIDVVPKAFACLPEQRAALYEFVEGEKIPADQISTADVEAAASFFKDLNRQEHCEKANKLPVASEAFWTITEHLQHIDQRLAALTTDGCCDDLHSEFAALLEAMRMFWQQLRASIKDKASLYDIDPDAPLSGLDRCISPSDFGFHNALKRSDGKLVFIDFEYAGWDDPAKAVSDMFFQPASPVGTKHYDIFADHVFAHVIQKDSIHKRTQMLYPLFGLKWCCIILNPFVPAWAERSKFANPDFNLHALQTIRLKRAFSAFQNLQTQTTF